jgi:phosphatidylglycerol:prolipoprotein diacylglycerol transferase
MFWRPVYRYGLFYGITFFAGYLFLDRIGKKNIFTSFPGLQALLSFQFDTVFMRVVAGIMLWARLWHVFLYDWVYYQHHLWEIIKIWQWGMSFIWGVIGVIIVLLGVRKYYKLTTREFLLLGDLVLCIVPLGIFLWRIGNFLNKELYGLPLDQGSAWFSFLVRWWGAVDYGVDVTPTMRINTNIFQSLGEWLLNLLISQFLFRKQVVHRWFRPGLISWYFFVVYALARFIAEFLKELPAHEMYTSLSISQRLMFLFFLGWVALIRNASIHDAVTP